MTITNGANHHTVEDLLSSIRTSMSDDHVMMRQGPSSPMASQARRQGAIGDDNAEFELPAIFKPGHHQVQNDRPNNLFGRLSDALKPAAPVEAERSRTVIRFEPAAGRMIEPPPAAAAPQAPQLMAHDTRSDPPADAAERATQDNAPVRREMPSFFDTRLNRLGEMTRQANTPKQLEPPKPDPQPAATQPPPLRHPMQQYADAVQTGNATAGGLEDAAAQLLRPILKQWLTENMPKIVEKALRSEAGEDFPSQGTGSGGRKPGQ
jgi:cell pole-organizing protein PopZ